MSTSRRTALSIAALLAGAAAASVAVAGAQSNGASQSGHAAANPSAVTVGPRGAITCKFSHRLHILICTGRAGRAGRAGATGATGATGPPGARGPAGPSGSTAEVDIPLTRVPLTSGFMTDGGNVQNLATVGPVHIDGLCRQTSSNGAGTPAGVGGRIRYAAPFLTSGGETEAQIIVWSETGSLTFRGQVGPRINIPSGPPNYSAVEGAKGSATGDPVAGEGDHLFVASSNENTDENRATDPQVDNYASPGGARPLNRYPGFNSGDGPIATSDGHVAVAHMLAGFDSLGVYDQCWFAGYVTPVA